MPTNNMYLRDPFKLSHLEISAIDIYPATVHVHFEKSNERLDISLYSEEFTEMNNYLRYDKTEPCYPLKFKSIEGWDTVEGEPGEYIEELLFTKHARHVRIGPSQDDYKLDNTFLNQRIMMNPTVRSEVLVIRTSRRILSILLHDNFHEFMKAMHELRQKVSLNTRFGSSFLQDKFQRLERPTTWEALMIQSSQLHELLRMDHRLCIGRNSRYTFLHSSEAMMRDEFAYNL